MTFKEEYSKPFITALSFLSFGTGKHQLNKNSLIIEVKQHSYSSTLPEISSFSISYLAHSFLFKSILL